LKSSITWANIKIGKKKNVEVENFCSKRKKMFGLWVTPLVGRHVVNELKVGYQVVVEFGGF